MRVFSIKIHNNLEKMEKYILFKVSALAFYTFLPSSRQIMDAIPKELKVA